MGVCGGTLSWLLLGRDPAGVCGFFFAVLFWRVAEDSPCCGALPHSFQTVSVPFSTAFPGALSIMELTQLR
jgi:hypothetical protein